MNDLNIYPDFSTAKLKNERGFASVPMNATLVRPKVGDSLENRAIIPPAQTSNTNGIPPQKPRPTSQGPAGDDQLRFTVPLVPGMQPQMDLLQQDYHASQGNASQGKDSPRYHGKN